MHKLDIQEWAEETGAILEQARKALMESQQPEVRALEDRPKSTLIQAVPI